MSRAEYDSLDSLVAPLVGWINDATAVRIDPATARVAPLAGGHSNVTYLVSDDDRTVLVRRPPMHTLDESAHSMSREWTILTALADQEVPSAAPYGYCTDPSVIGAEFLVIEYLADSVAITDRLPEAYGDPVPAMAVLSDALADGLAALHAVDWRAVGLEGFGRPERFLERQVPRWEKQYRRNEVRHIDVFDPLTSWLAENLPPDQEPGIMHGDFHLDNSLFAAAEPRLLAIVDWEMTTIGDPLVDVGLMTAFWGERLVGSIAMPRVQAVTRLAGAPTRQEVIDRYAERSGRDVSHLPWYQAFAFWKLAIVIEAAWGQHVRGELRTDYTAALEHDVPALFTEAAAIAGLVHPGADR